MCDCDNKRQLLAICDDEQVAYEFADQEYSDIYLRFDYQSEFGLLVDPLPRIWIESVDSLPPLVF